jgi:signal peptidase II
MIGLQSTSPPTASRPGGRTGRLAMVIGILVACLACDQATKSAAVARLPEGRRLSFLGDCLRLERVRNPGSFLGLGEGLPAAARTVIFTWGVGAIVLAAMVVAFRRGASTRTACATALVAAGGLGNLWDRVVSGGWVTDFMNLGVGWLRTGIFNAADLAIVAGVVLLALPGSSTGADGNREGSRE